MNLPALQRFFSQDWHVLPSAIEPLVLAVLQDEAPSAGLRIDPRFATQAWADSLKPGRFYSMEEEKISQRRPTHDRNGDELPSMKMTSAGVAIVPIQGPLVKGATGSDKYKYGVISHEDVAEDLDEAVNQGAETILLDVNSPGGTVAGGPELAAKIDELAGVVDVFSYNSGCCASLAEYLTVGMTARFGLTSSISGSIGTILQTFDFTKMLEFFGITVNTFASGKYKGMGSPLRSLSDAQKEYLQGFVNQNAAAFKERMQLYRPDIDAASMEGQFFDGPQALKAGFLDELVTSRAEVLRAIS